MTDTFTGELWQGVTGIYEAILKHPFLTGLADGSLPDKMFAFYVVQDSLYLKQYGHTLAAIASRAPDASETEMFARHFIGVVRVEQQLHDELLGGLGIDPATVDAAEMAPTTLAFTSYLLATARGGSYAEAVAAVLPATGSTGRSARNCGAGDHRTRASSGGSIPTAARTTASTSRRSWASPTAWGQACPRAERGRLHGYFRTSSRYEWMFWDMGYRMESWPISV